MSEIKYGQRVNIDPDATCTVYGVVTTPTFGRTPHNPKGEYVVEGGPDEDGDLEIVQRVGGRARAWLWAGEQFVTPYVEHDAGEAALAVLGRDWCIGREEHLPSQSDILTGAAPADMVSTLAALAEATIRLVCIIERSADR